MSDRSVTVERVIDAPPEEIFAIVADPARHPDIDGSGTVKGTTDGRPITAVGQKFGMKMRLGTPYRSHNTVVEFYPDRVVAWKPLIEAGPVVLLGGQRWRYELEPQDDGKTLVRETYVWGEARFANVLKMLRYPERTKPNMEKTLERLAHLVEKKG